MSRNVAVRENGKAIKNAVIMHVDDKIYSGWKEVSFRKELLSLADSINTTLIMKPGLVATDWRIIPGQSVKLFIDNDFVFSGYFERADVSLGSRSIQVAGRSRAGDLIDSNFENPLQLNNISVLELFRKVCSPHNVKVHNLSGENKVIKTVSIKTNETPFGLMDRISKQFGLIIRTRPDGDLEYFKNSKFQRSKTELHEGVNVKGASFSSNTTERFSKYIVRSQNSNSHNIEGSSLDEGVERYRPKVIMSETPVDVTGAKDRANWEASFALAKSQSVNVDLQGWRQESGELWDVGLLVRFVSPFLGFDTELLIKSVEFQKSPENGTTCSLELTSPESLDIKKKEVKKKDDLLSRVKWASSKP